RAADAGEPEVTLAAARQKITLTQGIASKQAKDIIARIKQAKLKV
ncbi:MAG TPA: YajQ family cyclic di-GMP-binding protein, partial [Xanthomonadales bacterium]|nr:YajQ family cyclic di-GMP-binding protein [Xanthomonadales bacterium]